MSCQHGDDNGDGVEDNFKTITEMYVWQPVVSLIGFLLSSSHKIDQSYF